MSTSILRIEKRGWYKNKGRQDRYGIHVAQLMNRFEHADTPSHNPYIVTWCATCKLHLYSWLLSSMHDFLYFQAVSHDYCVMLNV